MTGSRSFNVHGEALGEIYEIRDRLDIKFAEYQLLRQYDIRQRLHIELGISPPNILPHTRYLNKYPAEYRKSGPRYPVYTYM